MKKLLLVAISLIFLSRSMAQSWSEARTFTGTGNEQGVFMVKLHPGLEVLGGTYDKSISELAAIPNASGGRDIFLLSLRNEAPQSAIAIGGPYQDQLLSMATDGNGKLLVAGQYVVETKIDTFQLFSEPQPSATYLASFDEWLQLQWHFQVKSNGILDVAALAFSETENIYVAGTFQDSLWWQDTLLISAGNMDMFVAEMDPKGDLLWLRQFGESGDTRASAMTLKNGELFIAGVFNDATSFGGSGMTANTKDLDVFLLSMNSANGEVNWAVKAGGVFDEEVVKVLVDEEGNHYAFGQLIGVMNISPQESIQSSSGQSDLFLLKYDRLGKPLKAIAFNAPGPQLASDMEFRGNDLVISGYFQNTLSLPPVQFAPAENFHGFVASFEKEEFGLQWVLELHGNEGVYPEDVLCSEDDIKVMGNFSGRMQAGAIPLEAKFFSDIFLASVGFSTSAQSEIKLNFQVYPNPASDQIYIKVPVEEARVQIWDTRGVQQLDTQISGETSLEIPQLPNGQYWIVVLTKDKRGIVPLVIAK